MCVSFLFCFIFCKVRILRLATGFKIFIFLVIFWFYLRNLILPSIYQNLLLGVFVTVIWKKFLCSSFTWFKIASRSFISYNVLVMFSSCTSISANISLERLRFLRHCFWNFINLQISWTKTKKPHLIEQV